METDRSRVIAYQRCPRERFLAYHVGGNGIQRIRKSLPLQFGSAFHEGAEVLLSFHRDIGGEGKPISMQIVLEEAVKHSHRFLQEQFSAHQISFDGEQPADVAAAMAYGQEEQMALAEALLRGWWLYEGESFLRTFEVIEVEREGRAVLTQRAGAPYYAGEGNIEYDGPEDDLVLMFRPDALVRDRESGDLYVVSWKTCATFGKRNTDQARHDMQSMSEVWGVEQDVRTLAEQMGVAHMNTPFRIEGVLYKWIVKGRRSLDKWDNLYKQNSPLVYGWAKLDTLNSEFPEWSWSWDWEDEEGKSRKLGKGWQKKSIWNNYPGGVKAWVEGLAANQIFPRHKDALAEVFPQAMPVERSAKDVESWKRQVVAQEMRIAENLNALQFPIYGDVDGQKRLDELFPQYTHSCHSYSGCSFIPICHEGVKAEPGELYQIRSANHPEKGDDDGQ